MIKRGMRKARPELPQLKKSEMPQTRVTRSLHGNLQKLCDQEVRRLRALVRSEFEYKTPVPTDAMDDARQHEETELQASLIEMSEKRLAAIFDTFERMEAGHYGICEECGDQISVERLRAIPTAVFCVDCQSKAESAMSGTYSTRAHSLQDELGTRPSKHDERSGAANRKAKRSDGIRSPRRKEARRA